MSPPNEVLSVLGRCRVCGGDVTAAGLGFLSCEGCGLVYNKVPPSPRIDHSGLIVEDVERRLCNSEHDVTHLYGRKCGMMTPEQREGQRLLDNTCYTVWFSLFRAALTGVAAQLTDPVRVAGRAAEIADAALECVVEHNTQIYAAMAVPEKVQTEAAPLHAHYFTAGLSGVRSCTLCGALEIKP